MELSRRQVIRGAGLAVGTLSAAATLPGSMLDPFDAFAADTTEKTSLTPVQALAWLKAGNRRFVSGRLRHPRRESYRRAAVAEGQAPFAVVLGCADSRVPPEVIYDQGLGDLFVTRIAGNTGTDPYVVGTVEYGAAELGSVAIVVLGHEECGACKAAIDVAENGTQLPGDIGAFVAPIVPIAEQLIPTTSEGPVARRGHPRERPQGRHRPPAGRSSRRAGVGRQARDHRGRIRVRVRQGRGDRAVGRPAGRLSCDRTAQHCRYQRPQTPRLADHAVGRFTGPQEHPAIDVGHGVVVRDAQGERR